MGAALEEAEPPARDFGPRPELTWLPVDRLRIDPGYQRRADLPAGNRLIRKIAEEFDWSMPIRLSYTGAKG
jgi:hypothetical protein